MSLKHGCFIEISASRNAYGLGYGNAGPTPTMLASNRLRHAQDAWESRVVQLLVEFPTEFQTLKVLSRICYETTFYVVCMFDEGLLEPFRLEPFHKQF